MYKFRHGSNPNHPIHYGKSYVHHYTTGVAGGDAYNFWQKYRGGNTSKIKSLFESILGFYSYFKSFTVLASKFFTPWTPTAKATQLHKKISGRFTPRYCSQNRALKKRKFDSNPRYGPGQWRRSGAFIVNFKHISHLFLVLLLLNLNK